MKKKVIKLISINTSSHNKAYYRSTKGLSRASRHYANILYKIL